MPLTLIYQDITRLSVDAVVNAANQELAPGGGVCGAIFSAAGYDQLDRACRAIGHCDVGQAVLTPGFRLSAKYIIHAVGPIWQGGGRQEAALLRSCYLSALQLAQAQGCESIAFPLISAGIYGYPRAEALAVATETIRAFLQTREMQVYLALIDREMVQPTHAPALRRYLQTHLTVERAVRRADMPRPLAADRARPIPPAAMMEEDMPHGMEENALGGRQRKLSDLVDQLDESFARMLLRLIDQKGMTDVEVYKRANLDRKLFSKLRREGHNPSKATALALAIALRLNLDETRDLLGRAGYSLSHSHKFDVIIEYFISEGIYDIDEINQALFAYDQRLLGA